MKHNFKVRWKVLVIAIGLIAIIGFCEFSLKRPLESDIDGVSLIVFDHIIALSVLYFFLDLIVAVVSQMQSLKIKQPLDKAEYERFHPLGPLGDMFLYSVTVATAFYASLFLLRILLFSVPSLTLDFAGRITGATLIFGDLYVIVKRTARLGLTAFTLSKSEPVISN